MLGQTPLPLTCASCSPFLGGQAEFERELTKARTGEGRRRAKARGVHLGRPPALKAYQRQEAPARREAGETLADIPGPMACTTQRPAGFGDPISVGRWLKVCRATKGTRALKVIHYDAGVRAFNSG